MASFSNGLRPGWCLVFFLSLATATSITAVYPVAESNEVPSRSLLQVLSQVLRGPARDSLLILHLDGSLPPWTMEAVQVVDGVRRAPHLTFTLGATPRFMPDLRTLHASTLHLVVFVNTDSALLQSMWQLWRPRNLLLFSLHPAGGTAVLHEAWLGRVQRLALITSMRRRAAAVPVGIGVYTVFPLSSSTPRLLALWRRDIFADWDSLFPDRFPTFHGQTLKVVGWPYDWPFLHKQDPKQVSGMCLKLLKLLSASLNFKFHSIWVEDTGLGGSKTNGSWSGVSGEVYRRAANVSFNIFFLNEQFFADFDLSKSFWEDGYSAFLIKRIPTFAWTGPLRPFQTAVWLAVVASAVSAVLFVTLQVSRCSSSARKGKKS